MFRDIRIAIRAVRVWRLGAAAAVVTLATGIASTTVLSSMLSIVLAGSSAGIEDVARVGRIYPTNPSLGIERTLPSIRDFEEVLADIRSFESVAAYADAEMSGRADGDEDTWPVMRVSPALFELLRIRPADGRLFSTADVRAGHQVAVVSESGWRGEFAGRSLSDRLTIRFDGVVYEVIGVLPAAADFPFIGLHGDAWIPLAGDGRRRANAVSVIARLRPDRTWDGAQSELSRLAAPAAGESWRWRAIPLTQDTRRRTLGAASGTLLPAFIVLLIACVNVACMILARGVERATEFSVRAALGASRGAIVRQLLVENGLLALVAGAAGVGLAAVGLRAIAGWLLPVRPTLAAGLTVDLLQLVPIGLGASALACLLFGLVPALRLSRRDIASSLKGGSPPSRARIAGYDGRDLIVFLETAFAVVLVVVTALWFSFFSVLEHAVAGFPAGEVVTHRIAFDEVAPAAERLRAVPGVHSTSLMSQLPGGERSSMMLRSGSGRAARGSLIAVGDAFFETLGLAIVRGRPFDRTEIGSEATVAVVSESVAAALWPGEDALGKDLIAGDGVRPRRLAVVGICRNALEFGGLGVLTAGDVYRPIGADHAEVTLVIRAHHATTALPSMAAALRASASAPMPRVTIAADALEFPREPIALIRVVGLFALVALLLAGGGIFGVTAQSVAQRTREFGVRMALGASARRVLLMVLAREAKLIAAAMACAIVATVAATRTLFAELVTISALHPAWPAALTAACALVAAVACLLATYRIVRLEPSVILRNDLSWW